MKTTPETKLPHIEHDSFSSHQGRLLFKAQVKVNLGFLPSRVDSGSGK
jgi:hypothetical protein